MNQETQRMESQYNFADGDWQNINVDHWTQDSFRLTKSNVYVGVKPNVALSKDYIAKNADAIQRQVVLGGLRLAYAIQHIFGSRAEEPEVLPEEDGNSTFLQ